MYKILKLTVSYVQMFEQIKTAVVCGQWIVSVFIILLQRGMTRVAKILSDYGYDFDF